MNSFVYKIGVSYDEMKNKALVRCAQGKGRFAGSDGEKARKQMRPCLRRAGAVVRAQEDV